MTRRSEDEPEEGAVRGPIEWLFNACLLLLGCAIALTFTLSLLAQIWPWLVLIGLVVGGVAVWVRLAANRRRDW